MRTVFVVVSKDIVRRNVLETDFWPKFMAQKGGARVVLFVERGKGTYYREKFSSDNVVVEEFSNQTHRSWSRFLFFLIRTGIRSRSTTVHRWRLYKRGDINLPVTLFRSFISFFFARFAWYKHMLRWLIVHARQPTFVEGCFEKYRPDLVFLTSPLDFAFNDIVSIEARRRGVRIISMMRSWDNLNHHGLLPVVPDRFVFQNIWLKKAAERFQAIDTNSLQTDIVGIPHYDSYKNPQSYLEPREAFFKRMGLDPSKKLIFAGGAEYYYSEDVLPKLLDDLIGSGAIRTPAQAVFRPHPSSMFSSADYKFSELRHVVPNVGAPGESPKAFSDTTTFINLLYHAGVTINIASTLSIDAAAFDKPVIAIGFDDPAKRLSYWESVERFNDHFDHQEHLLGTGGARIANSRDELARLINLYLDDPSLDKEGRKKILAEFVEPFDGHAGERLACILAEEVAKV